MATKAARPAKPSRKTVRESVPDTPDTPDPVDIAMAAAASGKPLPDAARSVLEKHARLIDCQARLTNAQCAELRLRKIGEGVRAALWAILALVAFVLLALIIAVVVRASRSDALVVQSFEVPAALQARGLTGKVVAIKVLDKLAAMQEQTQSIRAASTYANNWEDELSIDIPNTGTTTDDIWKLLQGWLGKETRISGEVAETGQGLALTVRVGTSAGQTFVSQDGDLATLIAQGAELVYKDTQPYRYSAFISRDPTRWRESDAIYRRLSRDPSPIERKWAFNGLAANARRDGNFHAAIAYAQRMLEIDPNMAPAYSNLGQAYQGLGREQEAVDTFRRAARMAQSREYDPIVARQLDCGLISGIAFAIPDPKQLLEASKCASTVTTPNGALQEVNAAANAALFRHEPRLNVVLPPLPDDSPVETQFRSSIARLRAHIAGGSRESLSNALNTYSLLLAERMKSGPEAPGTRALYAVNGRSIQALALARLRRNSEAEAIIRLSPLDCYECLRVRGLVAEGLGRPQQAQLWYARTVRHGPRLARAYVDWARLLARFRRFKGAEARFRTAADLAPNWADPLKYWGDALAAQGRREHALEKYDAALKLAPKWAELRQDRARLVSTK